MVLMVCAMAIPAAFGWQVRADSFPPLHAKWLPRVGPGTLPALALAVVGGTWALSAAQNLPWRRLLALTWVFGAAWMFSLALVDGVSGIDGILGSPYEYLRTARATTDISATLHEYISRIPSDSSAPWPVHVAGHPPGALMFFVLLVRLGLGSDLVAGIVVVLLAATTPVAVLVAARALGVELQGRRALPFVVLAPAAIWQAVSADAMFAAVAAWGLATLALGAARRSVGWSLLAGVILGYTVTLSYGLPLLAFLAVAVLLAARAWFPLGFAVVGALAVVLTFAALGFPWWEALPVLHERYWDGLASLRPASYWLWGNLAALAFCAGPLLGAALASAGPHLVAAVRRPSQHVVGVLVVAAVLTVVAADVSLMSKAEVERIWLPFVPWLLLSTVFLPERWRRPGLVLQIGMTLALQHLLWTDW
ncbi:hypothetical protein ATL42_2191 [Sanguibacter antarcticus]|uniref:Integral membrane protein n=1 Tax=Sanguibacter antarcticus TaxID=372484 RepID=A0A2A9E7J5_9MICO|nr:hypothetical protein ATL42_2191 [Sanguibacter antarcticus]